MLVGDDRTETIGKEEEIGLETAILKQGEKYFINRIRFKGFKSFKNEQINLPDGFVALAGPNGSGKSNVTDAIRFALGEVSLKSLRAKRVTELINQNCAKAEVILNISGKKKFEVRRAIREDGKTAYSLNGKKVTRTQVKDVLRAHGIALGSHNIIAQGQVQRIVEMNAKDRRAIVDEVAGISEFDQKKNEALSELGKVDSRISEARIIMAERTAFLQELGKEKDAALSYQEAQESLKRARATLVHGEYKKLEKQFESLIARKKEETEGLEKLKQEQSTLEGRIRELENQRKELAQKLNQGSGREKLASQIEEIKVQIAQLGAREEEKESREGELKESIKALNDEEGRIKRVLLQMKKEETLHAEKLKKLEIELERKSKEAGIIGRDFGEKEKLELGELEKRVSELREERAALLASHEKGKQMLQMEKQSAEKLEREIESLREAGKGGTVEEGKYRQSLKIVLGQIEKLFVKEKELNRKIPQLDKELLEKKERAATLRGSVSPAARNPALLYVMQLKKDGETGIYGTVAELVSVDDKYKNAVEAAGGGRLAYVVVDSIGTADKIISKLKKSRAGRCTFIPLDRPIRASERAGARLGMGRLIGFIDYDKAFESAISYVFGSTVLCSSISEAKKIGIGKARMVTLGGELIEASGVVSGGSMRGSMMSRSSLIKAESEIESLKAQRDAAYSSMYEVREEINKLRKEKHELELSLRRIEVERGNPKEREEKLLALGKELGNANKEISKHVEMLKGQEKRISAVEKEIGKCAGQIESLKGEIEKAAMAEKEESGKAQEEYKRMVEERASLDSIISSKKREYEMLSAQLGEIKKKVEKTRIDMHSLAKALEEISSEKGMLEDEKAKLEEKLSHSKASVRKTYEKMQKLQLELDELGAQMGKIRHASESKGRECNDIEVRLASVQTKLADLKAEWEKYSEIPLLDASKKDLEEIARNSETKLAALGNVNLKAPQMYEQKRKEIEEVEGRISTLESEKAAVMELMDEIERKKRNIFMETFNEVNKHFQRLFKMVFPGNGTLVLDSPSNPLESGLLFKVREERDKRDRYLNSMSGGEQTLLALMFMFALHMRKPSPFYVLDEAEAALDKENSRKMADFIRQLSKTAQFIVVTHNDAVLSSADVALGVAKVDGSSKIVGVELASAMGRKVAKQVAGGTGQKPAKS